MRLIATLLLASTCTLSCHAQHAGQLPARTEIPANIIIPTPPPTASLSDWAPEAGRAAVSLDLDNATLRGFRYTGKKTDAPTLLFFNGNGMTIDAADPLYRRLAALGPTVVVYDYRGYGFSSGKPDVMTYRDDALRAYDAAAADAPNHRVIVYGFSLGTAFASYIASQRQIAALVLAAPIASAEEELPIYARLLGYTAETISRAVPSTDAKLIFGEASMVAQSQAPLIVIHGTSDNVVPINQGREVFGASPSTTKRFITLRGAGHNETASDSASFQAVKQLIDSLH